MRLGWTNRRPSGPCTDRRGQGYDISNCKSQPRDLGGRLPLRDPRSLGESARKLFDRIDSTMVKWADAIHFQSKTPDGRLIGPFNPVLFSPEIASRFLDLQ